MNHKNAWTTINPFMPNVPFFDIGKQCRPRSDAAEWGYFDQNAVSDQSLCMHKTSRRIERTSSDKERICRMRNG